VAAEHLIPERAQLLGQARFHLHRGGIGFKCAYSFGTSRSPQRRTTPAALMPFLWFRNRSSGVRPVIPT
jgi:hypothetical protein